MPCKTNIIRYKITDSGGANDIFLCLRNKITQDILYRQIWGALRYFYKDCVFIF